MDINIQGKKYKVLDTKEKITIADSFVVRQIWRVPLISKVSKHKIGEIVIDAISTLIEEGKTTKPSVLKERILNGNSTETKKKDKFSGEYEISAQRNTIAFGDAETVLQNMAAKSVDSKALS